MIFEDDEWEQFAPLAHTRHLAQLPWGTRTLLESFANLAAPREVALWGREEIRAAADEAVKGFNAPLRGDALFISAKLRPQRGFWNLLERSGNFAAMLGGRVLAIRVKADGLKPGAFTNAQLLKLAKGMERVELPQGASFKGPWQLVESNGLAIVEQAGNFEESQGLPDKVTMKGSPSNLRVHDSVEIEGHVSFDTRLGPVVVREGTTIDSFSRLSGPCFLGPRNRVHSALVRSGTSVFEGCSIGGEVENSIVMAHSNKAHLGYLGDSIVGEWVNIGAGSEFSNLKNTYGNVRVEVRSKRLDTGMLKLGPEIADMAKVSIGTMIFAGKSVGVASHVSSLVDRNVPSFTYFDGRAGKKVELLLDSVVETQKKMMERRGLTLSKPKESMIRRLFISSRPARKRAGVRKGSLR